MVATLEVLGILFFILFLTVIKPNYLSTFFTTMTAKSFFCQCYHKAASDEAKIDIFNIHPSYYESIRLEIKELVSANWAKWNDEQPVWFDSRLVAKIPSDMIPKE